MRKEDGGTDMMQLIDAVGKFANAPKRSFLGLTYFTRLVDKFPTFYMPQTSLVHLLHAEQLAILI